MSEAVNTFTKPKSLIQWGVIVLLAGVVAIAALPHYVSGQWPWMAELPVPHLAPLRDLRTTALPLEGWEIRQHQVVSINGNQWSLTEYRATDAAGLRADTRFGLLLRPQTASDQQPEVEWMDLQGAQGWRIHDLHTVRLTVATHENEPSEVSTRYFRGLGEKGTLAVMQWYAWPAGGHFAPSRWFWTDQARQWQQRQRLPWVAVSVLLPIEPVGDIRSHRDTVVAIAQAIQTSLQVNVFQSSSDPL